MKETRHNQTAARSVFCATGHHPGKGPSDSNNILPEKKVRVLHVVSDKNIGGAGRYVIYLLDKISKNRFEIDVACPGGGKLEQELTSLGTRVLPLSPSCQDRSFSLPGISELLDIIRDGRYDIVHSHSSISARIAARLCNVKAIVYTRHGLSGNSPNMFSRMAQKFFSTYFADAVVAVSEAAKKDLINGGVVADKITVIHNGVDIPEVFMSGQKGQSNGSSAPDCLVVGSVGRLSPEKGHVTFIRAASSVAKEFPKSQFLIVGDGPLRPALESLASDIGLLDKIRFAGYQADVRPFLDEMDIFVLPSYTEAMPLSLLEAMANGLPVVASCVGGVPEAVEDNVTGFLVAPHDEDALAKKILLLLRSEALRRSMGKSSRTKAESAFSIRITADKVAGVYDALLETR
jgi:glycosyltransferase involved in cell wall biosynthesis